MLIEPGTKTGDAGNSRLCSRAFDIKHHFVAPEWSGGERIVVIGVGRRAQNSDVAVLGAIITHWQLDTWAGIAFMPYLV